MAPDDAFSWLTSPPGDPYLCASCIDTLTVVGGGSHTFVHGHLTRSGFLEAVANKCFICWRLFQTLDSTCQECLQTLARYEHLEDPERDYRDPLTSLAEDPKIHVSSNFHTNRWTWNLDPATLPDLAHVIEVMDKGKDVGFNHVLVKMDDYTEASKISQWIKSCDGFVDATAWEETIDLIRQWLQACDSGHRQCNDRARDTSWFPRRVLDLGPQEPAESDGTTVKVIKREQVVPGNRYVTLSHRWNPLIPKLTSRNLEAWSRQIPVEALTKTFRDFITVSRLLGFRYAWIDSLCIIQESDHGGSDWSQECLTMDLVYRNSFCNLSADWPTDSDGFFLNRKARQFDLPIVSINFPTIEDSQDSEGQEFEYLLVDNSTWQYEVTNSPINSRGWVLQERFLSPRVLHFCRNEVIFECCEASKSERFRQSMPAIDVVAFEPFKNLGETLDGTYDTAACYRLWNRVPGIYTRCTLTYPEDKLVAISGIARYLKTFLVDDVYVMGVWASDINAQMLWMCDENTIRTHIIDYQTLSELKHLSKPAVQTVSTPLRQCKGPTFSWVSTDQPVSFSTPFPSPTSTWKPVCGCTRLVKYREGQVQFDDEPITEDIFDYPGQPMVELKVTGLLHRVRLIDIGATYLHAVFLDENDYRPEHYESLRHNPYNIERVFLDFTVDPSGIPNIESRVCFCIPWADAGLMSKYANPSISIVLELVDPKMVRFSRIGIISHFSSILQPVVNFSGWNYDPETRMHTIYII
ncbi:heterokaryon incompatibility protein-domain-containing protein [Fusarium solani]|uniref:Heterokaryon incompatibility protein-domain-containing protein n=1 Tax=Fusarium solani TaxID=169388 RepID=A0A9P9GRI2_FUSSL|nr:heterokaryon incompatibility protein-domain-containing protein [Fusarium solani]KAH7242949.1 heterokaryon incompatibility protein-domain-containing protein [Fusarium solani]